MLRKFNSLDYICHYTKPVFLFYLMEIISLVGKSLYAAVGMFWEIFWALVLGFALSGIIIAFVPKKRIAGLLGHPSVKALGLAAFSGSVSSSCSYAAAAMTRSLFQKGAHIIPALAFMLASTNLVIELSAILWILMGWQFVVAEFVGGIILVLIMAILMRLFGPLKDFKQKQKELEGFAHDETHGTGIDTADPKTLSGWRRASQAFLMEWKMIWKDIALGVVIAGFLMVLVPDSFWRKLFLETPDASLATINPIQILENALVGPLISVISFVCSVGNIPLASVLYHGGITFGGVISFIYADLIIIPLILVYRKYYGWKLALWITGIFYIAMVTTGIIVDLLFHLLGLIPKPHGMGEMSSMHFFEINYTFWLNIIFLVIALVLVWLAKSGVKEKHNMDEYCHH